MSGSSRSANALRSSSSVYTVRSGRTHLEWHSKSGAREGWRMVRRQRDGSGLWTGVHALDTQGAYQLTPQAGSTGLI